MTSEPLTDHPGAPDIESSTKEYAARFSGEIGQWFIDVQSRGTARLLEKAGLGLSGLKVLDVGGGHAQNIALMKKLGHHLTILGSNTSCKALFERLEGVDFDIGKLTVLPYADKTFDVVLCYRIMAHIDDWPLLVKELSRVAKSLVIVDFTSSSSVNALADVFFSLKKSIEKNTRFYRMHRGAEVVQIFTLSGMQPVAKYAQYFFPMALHRALKSKGLASFLEAIARSLGLTRLLGSPVLYAFKPCNPSDE